MHKRNPPKIVAADSLSRRVNQTFDPDGVTKDMRSMSRLGFEELS
jgi:hypothetical protein